MPDLRGAGFQILQSLLISPDTFIPEPSCRRREPSNALFSAGIPFTKETSPGGKPGTLIKSWSRSSCSSRPASKRFFPITSASSRPFPSLPHLARAPLQSVLKLWAGLGYYARARNLHAAAKIIVKDLGGKIPSTKEALLALPGFGPYTAGAVASIAFNQRAAALDGNVKRVLSRLSGISDSASPLSEKKRLENFAEDLVPEGYASEFNQALMDLGATVCLPARPKCPILPDQEILLLPGDGEESRKSDRNGIAGKKSGRSP